MDSLVNRGLDWLGGEDRESLPRGPDRWAQSQQVTGPEPESIRDRYRARAYRQVGAEGAEDFNAMDPRIRNTRITGSYADMYMSNPDVMKWAGEAAYASDLVGVGIAATDGANSIPIPGLPGMDLGDGLELGADVDTELLNDLLARGNAGIYEDLMWQHMAMQEGGIEMMRASAEAGEIPEGQMVGWEEIAAGEAALREAQASGDQDAIAAANERIWAGNHELLRFEQREFAQSLVYDSSPEARALFERISPGMVSPIPGGTSFVNDRDAHGESMGDADIGNREDRWNWVDRTMSREYREREEGNNPAMMRDMRRFSANADVGVPGLPVNTEDPLDTELPSMPDIPYLPRALREGRRAVNEGVDWIDRHTPDLPRLPTWQDMRNVDLNPFD